MPARDAISGATALCGLGMTELGRVYERSAADLAAEAVLAACADAGLAKDELDGLLINAGISQGVDLSLAPLLGLRELSVLTQMNAYGSSAGQMVQYAALAVHHGLARHVACVFADAPLVRGQRAGAAYGGARARRPGMGSIVPALGFAGPIPFYAMHAQRHMDVYGTTQDQLGAIALAARAWAARNPRAQMREPLSLAEYHASPLGGGALPRARLLPGLERGDLRDRHQRRARARARQAAGLPARHGPGAPARVARRPPEPGAAQLGDGVRDGGLRAGRHRAVSDLRLLHLHRARRRSRTTASASAARADRSSRAARSRPAARCPRTPAAACSRRTTCGA